MRNSLLNAVSNKIDNTVTNTVFILLGMSINLECHPVSYVHHRHLKFISQQLDDPHFYTCDRLYEATPNWFSLHWNFWHWVEWLVRFPTFFLLKLQKNDEAQFFPRCYVMQCDILHTVRPFILSSYISSMWFCQKTHMLDKITKLFSPA